MVFTHSFSIFNSYSQSQGRLYFRSHHVNGIRGIARAKLLLPPAVAHSTGFHVRECCNNCLELLHSLWPPYFDPNVTCVVTCFKHEIISSVRFLPKGFVDPFFCNAVFHGWAAGRLIAGSNRQAHHATVEFSSPCELNTTSSSRSTDFTVEGEACRLRLSGIQPRLVLQNEQYSSRCTPENWPGTKVNHNM